MATESVGAPQWSEPRATGVAANTVPMYLIASGADWALSETGPAAAVIAEDAAGSGVYQIFAIASVPSGARRAAQLKLASGDVIISY